MHIAVLKRKRKHTAGCQNCEIQFKITGCSGVKVSWSSKESNRITGKDGQKEQLQQYKQQHVGVAAKQLKKGRVCRDQTQREQADKSQTSPRAEEVF